MATKARTSHFSATSLTAGAGNQTSTLQDLSTKDGATVNIKLTNGATGPTIAAQAQIQVANDGAGTLMVNFGGPLVGGTANSGVSSWSIDLPLPISAVQIVAGSNTGQAVTIDADVSAVSAFGS